MLEVADNWLRELRPPPLAPRSIGRVTALRGAAVEASGLQRLAVGDGVMVVKGPHAVRGEIVGFRGATALLNLLASEEGIAPGAEVRCSGESAWVNVGASALGRVQDALGGALDGGPTILGSHRLPLRGGPANPLERRRVTEPLRTGVQAIDALTTLGIGQRVALIAGSGVGKSTLLHRLIANADADACVIGLIGERAREVCDLAARVRASPAASRTAIVATPADQPPLLRLRAAWRATAIAEALRAEGRRVLLVIDSLTRVAHAQRELGLALGEPPTAKGYPPSALAILPPLIERAGGCARSGGSITAVYAVLADGDDADDPVVDTVRAITDGHILLSRSLAEAGVYPAIDVGRSLSRVFEEVSSAEQRTAARHFRALWAAWEANRDLVMMGAHSVGVDPLLDEAVERRHELTDFVREAAVSSDPVAALVESFGGGS